MEATEDLLPPASETTPNADDLPDFVPGSDKNPSLKDLLQSPDSPSRYMSFLAVVFALLGIFCLALLTHAYLKYQHSAQKPVKKKVEPVVEKTFNQELGEFVISWDHSDLRVNITAECASLEACDQLKEHLSRARDATLPVLQGSSREQILNPEKKVLLRQAIAEKLTDLKLGGKITDVNFTDMTVEVTH